MPRKTAARLPRLRQPPRFNEAAARCRGKHTTINGAIADTEVASMRPRPDAAENLRDAKLEGGDVVASMRPRPDAAENARRHTPENGCPASFNEAAARCRGKRSHDRSHDHTRDASMRPRPDAAENLPGDYSDRAFSEASMRPRPDAAENISF